MSEIRPVFVLSLPRSGSTLVQRVLTTHPEATSRAEPWLLLPLLYALRTEGVFAEYDQAFARQGLSEFVRSLPSGENDYYAAVNRFATSLYAGAAGHGERVFIDKTPRYSLVVDELARAFPHAPLIVLWRNPLAIAASIVETWGEGRWNVHKFKVDLFTALPRLVRFVRDEPERVLAVRFEDLISDAGAHWPRVFEHAGLAYDPSLLERFGDTRLDGSMGDPTGQAAYDSVSREPLEKWKRAFASPVRKRWGRRYLRWLGRERLALMGYDHDDLQAQLASIPSSTAGVGADLWFSAYGVVHHAAELKQLRLKLSRLGSWPDVHAHR